MTTTAEGDVGSGNPTRQRFTLALAALLTVPGVALRLLHPDLGHALEALLFGLAIVGAAFLLAWAAEVAQLDISAGAAIAVLFVAWSRWRAKGERERVIHLGRSRSVELSYLAVGCRYSLTLPLKRTVTLVDAAVLVGIFVAYAVRISKAPAGDPHLVGPAHLIGGLPPGPRRAAVAAMAVAMMVRNRHHIGPLLRGGLRTPYSRLVGAR